MTTSICNTTFFSKQASYHENSLEFTIIQAQSEHIKGAKALVDANRAIFAFITRQAFVDAYLQNGLLVATDNQNKVVGFIRYYHRKTDRQTTLYDICVTEEWRNQGIGWHLLKALILECQAQDREFILLKCPAYLSANNFYARQGFNLISTQQSKNHELNIWQLRLNLMEA